MDYNGLDLERYLLFSVNLANRNQGSNLSNSPINFQLQGNCDPDFDQPAVLNYPSILYNAKCFALFAEFCKICTLLDLQI